MGFSFSKEVGSPLKLVDFGLACTFKRRQVMTEAVGTAAAAGFPIALTAALTNIVVGWHAPNLPEHAIGYVHWVAWLGIVLVSVPFARLGARLAHALPALLLKRLFALILVVVGLRFLLA